MKPRYRVTLTKEERIELESLTRRGKIHARRFIHARALLLCDAGAEGPAWSVADTAAALGVSSRTIEHLKKRFVEEGLEAALERKPREKPPREATFDGAFEARLIALACTDAPEGTPTMDRQTSCGQGGRIAYCLIRFAHDNPAGFKKNELKPHLSKYWKIPPKESAAFVANMEDVLEVYHLPYDPDYPVVCMDESSKQLIGEVREPIPCAPGQPERIGDEYVRNGVVEILLFL